MNESLRNVELPVLPLDANSLTFGDWLVVGSNNKRGRGALCGVVVL